MFSSRRLTALGIAAVSVLTLAAGCSSDDSSSSDTTSAAPAAEATTSVAPEPEVLKILVTNDDGVSSEGISVVTEALAALPNTEVTVVAPATQQSGQGGKETGGTLVGTETTTAAGYPATSVEGFPADSIIYALDQDGIDFEPNVVVSGINEGQNIGGATDVSGTVGAARASVARGIPALASSSGTSGYDYDTAAELVVEWVEEHRAGLLDGTYAGDVVLLQSLNVPSCATGTIRGVVEVENVNTTEGIFQEQDCTSTLTDPANDVIAFNNGFASLATISPTPATTTTTGAP